MNIKNLFTATVVFVVFVSSFFTLQGVIARSEIISPLTDEAAKFTQGDTRLAGTYPFAPTDVMPSWVSGGLYGTDGDNLYLINKTTGSANLIGSLGLPDDKIGALAFDSNGTLYGMGRGIDAKLYTINPATGAATDVGSTGLFIFEGGLAFDASGQLFGVDTGNSSDAKLFTLNTTTGAATIVGPTPGESRDLNGLAYDDNTLYAIDRLSNSLGTVNPQTGSYTAIGNLGDSMGDTGGLAVDPIAGTMYATFYNTGALYTLDKSTGSATFVNSVSAVYGLAFAPAVPSLDINHADGQPGSFFTLTGTEFPANSMATVTVNGRVLSDNIAVDASGGFDFILDTSQADPGRYVVAATVNPRATADFALDTDADLRPQEGSGPLLTVPSGIAFTEFVYLPFVQR